LIREGLKNDPEPIFQGIAKKSGDLDLAIEIDTHDLLDSSKEDMQRTIERAILIALVSAGKRYDRPMTALQSELAAMEI